MSNRPRSQRPFRPPSPNEIVSVSVDMPIDEHLRRHLDAAQCDCDPTIATLTVVDGVEFVRVDHTRSCQSRARTRAEAN